MAGDNADRAERVQRLTGRLMRRMRAQADDDARLSLTQDWVMALLIDAPTSSAELARIQGVRAQTMSTAVAGLEKAGYVVREPDPSDGRRALLRATDIGIDAHERSRARKQHWVRSSLEELSPEQLAALDAGLDVLEHIADA